MRKSAIAIAFTLTFVSGVACAQQSSPPSGNLITQDKHITDKTPPAETRGRSEVAGQTGLVDRFNRHLEESRERAESAATALRERQRRDQEMLRQLDSIDQQK